MILTTFAAQPARHAVGSIAVAARFGMDASLFNAPAAPVNTPLDAINHEEFPRFAYMKAGPLYKTLIIMVFLARLDYFVNYRGA